MAVIRARNRPLVGVLATVLVLTASVALEALGAGPQRRDAAELMDELMAGRGPIAARFR